MTCALTWINTDGRRYERSHPQHQRHPVTDDGHAIVSTTKTTRSTRTLPIPDSVYSALLRARALRARDRVTNRDRYQDSGYVVVDEYGSPYRPDRIMKAWRKACIKAKVPTIRLHDARHTCATLMNSPGRPNRRYRSLAGSRGRWLHDEDVCTQSERLAEAGCREFPDACNTSCDTKCRKRGSDP